jgi:hypothetical protein
MRLTTSPPSCAECHEIREPKPPGTLWATPDLLRDSFTFTFTCVLYEVKTEYVYLVSIIISFQGVIAEWISRILWSNIVPDDGGGYCVRNIEILFILIGWYPEILFSW